MERYKKYKDLISVDGRRLRKGKSRAEELIKEFEKGVLNIKRHEYWIDAYVESRRAAEWLGVQRLSRVMVEAMRRAGYETIENHSRKDGRYTVDGEPQLIFGRVKADNEGYRLADMNGNAAKNLEAQRIERMCMQGD